MELIAAVIIAVVVYYVLSALAGLGVLLSVIAAVVVFIAIWRGTDYYRGRRL